MGGLKVHSAWTCNEVIPEQIGLSHLAHRRSASLIQLTSKLLPRLAPCCNPMILMESLGCLVRLSAARFKLRVLPGEPVETRMHCIVIREVHLPPVSSPAILLSPNPIAL